MDIDLEQGLRDLLAEREITAAMHRYLRGVDRCDVDLIKSAYHPDARDRHGDFDGLGTDFADALVNERLLQFTASSHHVSNMTIELDGDRAFVETYFMAVNVKPDHRLLSVGGRYIDRFERRVGEWKVADRQVVLDWDTFGPPDPEAPRAPFVAGRRDRSDLVYERPEA